MIAAHELEAQVKTATMCIKACQGLTAEQVAAIPALVAWFTAPASADYLDLIVPEHQRLATIFPRREAKP